MLRWRCRNLLWRSGKRDSWTTSPLPDGCLLGWPSANEDCSHNETSRGRSTPECALEARVGGTEQGLAGKTTWGKHSARQEPARGHWYDTYAGELTISL